MCFGGGSKSTNNVNTPAYAATPEAGAKAVIEERVTAPSIGPAATGLSDRPTQADFTSTPRGGAGLSVKGM
ncbi:hypothetical protein [Methylobacterium marchantiae]|uniref:Uncharacterized protein n=1 Tax=Methylobacterium marchantiae TaxID=600331 RepID=A0ABW3X1W9_9HYPH|nr:hypothetical protein AIGOOFII_3499 [Methylobacterium marchantiae]